MICTNFSERSSPFIYQFQGANMINSKHGLDIVRMYNRANEPEGHNGGFLLCLVYEIIGSKYKKW